MVRPGDRDGEILGSPSMSSLPSIAIEIDYVEEIVFDGFKGITGHWSKWGGRRYDLIAGRQDSILQNIWNCQSCGEQIPNEFTPYKYEYPEGEFIRVCSVCLIDNCQILRERLLKNL